MSNSKPTDATLACFGGQPVRPNPIESTVNISPLARRRVNELMESGKLSQYYNGKWAREFEARFSEWMGADQHAIAVNSGTSALHLAVSAAGISRGDEVIVPAFCFVAAATAVVQNGAIPVVCDIDPETLTMDIEHAEYLIGPRTRAIMPVHFWGYPANAIKLRELCDRKNLVLIEDCAQAFGATIGQQKVGTFGDFSAFALSVRKHLACGEGGVVLCRDAAAATNIRQLSNYGKGHSWDDYISPGFSYRMPEFSAIIALDGLQNLDQEIASRQANAACYQTALMETVLENVPAPIWGDGSFFKFPILLPRRLIEQRLQIVSAIVSENVSCRIPHRPLYTIPWLIDYLAEFGGLASSAAYPVANKYHARLIEIETGPNLSLDDAKVSLSAVLKAVRHFDT